MRLKRKRWPVAIAVVVLLVLLAHVSKDRVRLLLTYRDIVSSPETREHLALIPGTEIWKANEIADVLNVGYAEFAFPFGEIRNIRVTAGNTIKIESEDLEMGVGAPRHYGYERFKQASIRAYELNWQQEPDMIQDGPISHRFSFSSEEWEYIESDPRRQELLWHRTEMPYAWNRMNMMSKPRHLLAVATMDLFDLETYVQMLLAKREIVTRGGGFFWETDILTGFVQSIIGEDRNYYVATCWDAEKKIEQTTVLIMTGDPIPLDELELFLTSYRYLVESITEERLLLQKLILDQIQNRPEFVPEEDRE